MDRYLFDAFPDKPVDPAASGPRNLEVSLRAEIHKASSRLL